MLVWIELSSQGAAHSRCSYLAHIISAHSEAGGLPRKKLELSPAALFCKGLASRGLHWVWDLPGCMGMSSQDSYPFAIPPVGWQLSHSPCTLQMAKGLGEGWRAKPTGEAGGASLSECAGWTRRGLLAGTSDAIAPRGMLKSLRYQDTYRRPCLLGHLLGLPVLGMCPQ